MARIEIGKYLAVDSRVCGGRLIFKGSRITVAHALEMIAAAYTPEGVSKQYRGIISPAAVSEAQTLVRCGYLKEDTAKESLFAESRRSHRVSPTKAFFGESRGLR